MMNYHPTTLKLLHDFKTGKEKQPSKDLLALLLELQKTIDYEELAHVVYKFKTKMFNVKSKALELRNLVSMYFERRNLHNGSSKETLLIYRVTSSDSLSDEVKDALKAICTDSLRKLSTSTPNQRYARVVIGKDKRNDTQSSTGTCIDKRENEDIENIAEPTMSNSKGNSAPLSGNQKNDGSAHRSKKKKTQCTVNNFLDIFHFSKVMEKTTQATPPKYLAPIVFDSNTEVYDLRSPRKETFRSRKDIVRPVRMTFVKFHDQLKPPMYKKREFLIRKRNTLLKIPQVLDYDEESDWEDDEGAEDIDSVDEEEDDVDDISQEWMDSDSDGAETTKSGKKPSIVFPNVSFTRYDGDFEMYSRLPVLDRKQFPNELEDVLKSECMHVTDIASFVNDFSRKYMILYSEVLKRVQLLSLKSCAEQVLPQQS